MDIIESAVAVFIDFFKSIDDAFHRVGFSGKRRLGSLVSHTEVSRANNVSAFVTPFFPKVACALAWLAFIS